MHFKLESEWVSNAIWRCSAVAVQQIEIKSIPNEIILL